MFVTQDYLNGTSFIGIYIPAPIYICISVPTPAPTHIPTQIHTYIHTHTYAYLWKDTDMVSITIHIETSHIHHLYTSI